MDEPTIELTLDEPPNGEWVDNCDVVASPTEEEVAEGNAMGQSIDPDDDDDAGFDPHQIRGFTTSPEPVTATERDRALAKARLLKKIMLEHGVPQVSIEILPGRPNSYGSWDALYTVSDMSHHTVSRYSPSSLTPVLALCKRGRSDLPGPLCNGYGGWDLTYRIITFGYANHPGYGGPYTVPALTSGKFTIPKDSARRYSWGTEWEGGLSEADWNKVLTNPRNGKKMTMREFMGRSNAALEKFLEIHEGAHMEHSTWTSRKIDRLGYTRAEGIAEKRPYRNPTPPQPRLTTIDLSNLVHQFRIANGWEKDRPTALHAVRVVQKALNEVYNLNLKVDGLVGPDTVRAWLHHETFVGGKWSKKVPDDRSIILLTRGRFKVRP